MSEDSPTVEEQELDAEIGRCVQQNQDLFRAAGKALNKVATEIRGSKQEQLHSVVNGLLTEGEVNPQALLQRDVALQVVLTHWCLTNPEAKGHKPKLTEFQDLSERTGDVKELSHDLMFGASEWVVPDWPRWRSLVRRAWVRVQSAAQEKPRWNAERRELSLDGKGVKRFLQPAPNQVSVLSAFEEEGWPPRIYAPVPSRKVGDTLRRLNAWSRSHGLMFDRDGTTEGVIWSRVGVKRP